MNIKSSVRAFVKKAGNTIKVQGEDISFKAVIHPLQYRNKLYVEEECVPAGMIDRGAFFYIGLPENDLSRFPRGTLFECNGQLLTLTHTEVSCINDIPQYVWAVFNLYSTET